MERLAIPVVLATLVLVAACGGSSSPTSTASGLLAKAGATSDGPAALVGPGDSSATCSTGATEADGTLNSNSAVDVSVCIFPSANDMTSFLNDGDYPAGSGFIQVGSTTLIVVDDNVATFKGGNTPSSMLQSIASATGGTVMQSGN